MQIMDKQTPTQVASEIMNMRNAFEEGNCDICEINGKILAYRTAWENELEFLERIKSELQTMRILSLTDDILISGRCYNKFVFIQVRISELTSALKILNTKGAEK